MSKYCYYSHFINEQAGTERLSNAITVTQLASGEIGIPSQIVSSAQNILLLLYETRGGTRGSGDAVVNFSFYQNSCH